MWISPGCQVPPVSGDVPLTCSVPSPQLAQLGVHAVDLAEAVELLEQRARGPVVGGGDHRVQPAAGGLRPGRRAAAASRRVVGVGRVEVQRPAIDEPQRVEGDEQLEQRRRIGRHELERRHLAARDDVVRGGARRVVVPALGRGLDPVARKCAAVPALDVPAAKAHRARSEMAVDRDEESVRVVAREEHVGRS
ncbi:MAG TPA: hypothetical protein VGC59_16515, partial [Solirubrobacteraceae bacterium]